LIAFWTCCLIRPKEAKKLITPRLDFLPRPAAGVDLLVGAVSAHAYTNTEASKFAKIPAIKLGSA
jgi:hypothetical protein